MYSGGRLSLESQNATENPMLFLCTSWFIPPQESFICGLSFEFLLYLYMPGWEMIHMYWSTWHFADGRA